VLVPQVTYQNGVPIPITTTVSANLALSVTPQVTNDGNVRLSLTINRDVPSGQAVATRSISTEVVVESGNTLVLGGFFTSTSNLDTEGFPILRKLPLIGWLFGKETEGSERSELFFFVTPQILNAKKAGIGT
jgi:type IV pilus assembly protein PilQ